MEEQKSGQESGKQGQKPHKRRKRYSGTHPKKYEEKYKELNPEKYGDTIEKVIGKGSTPGRYAYFHLCAGDPGFSGHQTGSAWAGCNTWLWRTHKKDVGKAGRTWSHLWS